MKIIITGLIFSCIFTGEIEAMYSQKDTEAEHTREIGPAKKRLRRDNENDTPYAEKQRKSYKGKGIEKLTEKETIAVEQILNLCRNEISQQDKLSECEKREVINARCAFLSSVRSMLLYRQSLNRNYIHTMRLGEVMSRCRQELQMLENERRIFEYNQEKARQDAIDRFFQLKRAKEKAKL